MRQKIIKKSRSCGPEEAQKALGVEEGDDDPSCLERAIRAAQFSREDHIKDLDLQMKGTTDRLQNDIAK